jgi:hypothetical protein
MPGISVAIESAVGYGVVAILGTITGHISIGLGGGRKGRPGIIAGPEGDIHYRVPKARALLGCGKWDNTRKEQAGAEQQFGE